MDKQSHGTRNDAATTALAPRPPFEWHAAARALHAIGYQPYRPCPGDEATTLCGQTTTLTHEDFRRTVRLPMCTTCLTAWRHHQETSR